MARFYLLDVFERSNFKSILKYMFSALKVQLTKNHCTQQFVWAQKEKEDKKLKKINFHSVTQQT